MILRSIHSNRRGLGQDTPRIRHNGGSLRDHVAMPRDRFHHPMGTRFGGRTEEVPGDPRRMPTRRSSYPTDIRFGEHTVDNQGDRATRPSYRSPRPTDIRSHEGTGDIPTDHTPRPLDNSTHPTDIRSRVESDNSADIPHVRCMRRCDTDSPKGESGSNLCRRHRCTSCPSGNNPDRSRVSGAPRTSVWVGR